MSQVIRGTYQHGQIILGTPVDWPDGAQVNVTPLHIASHGMGIREEDWPATPEGIAALLQRLDNCQLLDSTREQEAAWDAIRT